MLVAVAAWSLVNAASAVAQNTLGELLDAGGKPLTKADVTAAVSGRTISGALRAGGEFRNDYRADGSVAGAGTTSEGRPYSLSGKWSVDDSGKLCADLRTARGNTTSACFFLFKNGDEYFVSDSASNRNALVNKRAITK